MITIAFCQTTVSSDVWLDDDEDEDEDEAATVLLTTNSLFIVVATMYLSCSSMLSALVRSQFVSKSIYLA